MATDNRLGELLVREKLISLAQLRQAQDEQKKTNTTLSYALAKLGVISDREITDFLSQQYRVETINLEEFEIDEDVVEAPLPRVAEVVGELLWLHGGDLEVRDPAALRPDRQRLVLVEVHDVDARAPCRQEGAQGGAGGGFPDPAL